jgi:hypothetical protein
MLQRQKGRAASKYDFIKVKVLLGENLQHYYVLSRFLIARTLAVTRVPPDTVRSVRHPSLPDALLML